MQPLAYAPLKSCWWIQKLAPNFSPAVTGRASWSVRLSLLCGAPASTEGHSMALPALGWKVTGEVPGVVPGMSRATQFGSVTPVTIEVQFESAGSLVKRVPPPGRYREIWGRCGEIWARYRAAW